MSVQTSTLEEINLLLQSRLAALGLDAQRMIDILGSDDPTNALADALGSEHVYPHEWSKPVLYLYEYETIGRWWTPRWAHVPDSGLSFVTCADRSDHVEIRVQNIRLYLPKRTSHLISAGPDLLVKPDGDGLLVYRPQVIRSPRYCPGAAD